MHLRSFQDGIRLVGAVGEQIAPGDHGLGILRIDPLNQLEGLVRVVVIARRPECASDKKLIGVSLQQAFLIVVDHLLIDDVCFLALSRIDKNLCLFVSSRKTDIHIILDGIQMG